MNESRKIRILLLPDLFPKDENDIVAPFILDFIRSLEKYCEFTILYTRLTGQKCAREGSFMGHKMVTYNLTSRKIPSILKPFLYLLWFYHGYQIGKKLKDIDIIHAHTFGAILNGTLGWLLSKKLKRPLVITEHLNPFISITNKKLLRLWVKIVLEKADIVLVVSEYQKGEIIKTSIFPKKIEIAYNPVDNDLFSLNTGERKIKHNNIIFASTLAKFKGAFITLQAFHKIINIYPDWTLTILGNGEEFNDIKDYLEMNENLQNRVKLIGSKTKSEINEHFQIADFFILPSLHESFGVIIAEAMSCGLPVIIGDKTAPVEYVDEMCGLLVDATNIDKISEAMKFMIKNYRNYDSEKIRNKVVEKFGLTNFGDHVYNIYRNLN